MLQYVAKREDLFMYYEKKEFAIIIGEVIVNECLYRKIEINTSKLMKLLYFMQRLHLQEYGEPMFTDEVIARIDGPYIQSISNYFLKGRLGFDDPYKTSIVLLDSHEKVANIILEKYGNISPRKLLKLSLIDESFKTIWSNGKGDNMVIPFEVLSSNKEIPKTTDVSDDSLEGVRKDFMKTKSSKGNEIGIASNNKETTKHNVKIRLEKITPFQILRIEEREYTKEELLEIVSKRINFIKKYGINKKGTEKEIDEILSAYNELIKEEKNKKKFR